MPQRSTRLAAGTVLEQLGVLDEAFCIRMVRNLVVGTPLVTGAWLVAVFARRPVRAVAITVGQQRFASHEGPGVELERPEVGGGDRVDTSPGHGSHDPQSRIRVGGSGLVIITCGVESRSGVEIGHCRDLLVASTVELEYVGSTSTEQLDSLLLGERNLRVVEDVDHFPERLELGECLVCALQVGAGSRELPGVEDFKNYPIGSRGGGIPLQVRAAEFAESNRTKYFGALEVGLAARSGRSPGKGPAEIAASWAAS